ncbi:carbohydrate ABC transporter permease [Lacticaseibacillus absianus]|uniref:carbohydrate ABC transporter permease n=1 Tax=Lacticaseibacillus absianus TaxID=2729623 RepID=UPI0015CD0118|nr:carbohydrate ABC transporter permease [Lacticaseibacillus absianus]
MQLVNQKTHKPRLRQRPFKEVAFDWGIKILFSLIILGIIYPLWFIIIASFSTPADIMSGNSFLWPKVITFAGYKELFSAELIWRGYLNTIIYTVVGTFVQLAVNLPAGYAVSRSELVGKKWIFLFFTIPMFIGGGLIPSYLNIRNLGLLNNPLALILPGAVSTYNILVIRTFFKTSIPESLWEASIMDGCSLFRYFIQIALPLSKAIIAVIGLWAAVGIWNSWFDAMIYLDNENLHPLQLVLRRVLLSNEYLGQSGANNLISHTELFNRAQMMKYAAMIVSTLPIMCSYPFLQKYFNQGVMIGSVKE